MTPAISRIQKVLMVDNQVSVPMSYQTVPPRRLEEQPQETWPQYLIPSAGETVHQEQSSEGTTKVTTCTLLTRPNRHVVVLGKFASHLKHFRSLATTSIRAACPSELEGWCAAEVKGDLGFAAFMDVDLRFDTLTNAHRGHAVDLLLNVGGRATGRTRIADTSDDKCTRLLCQTLESCRTRAGFAGHAIELVVNLERSLTREERIVGASWTAICTLGEVVSRMRLQPRLSVTLRMDTAELPRCRDWCGTRRSCRQQAR
ncbi:nucleoporin Pom152, partial [Aureobasidium melanogenum]